jgi:hypothetical protein
MPFNFPSKKWKKDFMTALSKMAVCKGAKSGNSDIDLIDVCNILTKIAKNEFDFSSFSHLKGKIKSLVEPEIKGEEHYGLICLNAMSDKGAERGINTAGLVFTDPIYALLIAVLISKSDDIPMIVPKLEKSEFLWSLRGGLNDYFDGKIDNIRGMSFKKIYSYVNFVKEPSFRIIDILGKDLALLREHGEHAIIVDDHIQFIELFDKK